MSKGRMPAPSRGERFKALEQQVKNLETSVRIMQMMQQQMGQSLMPLQQDMASFAAQFQTIQYTILAFQELLGIDISKLNEIYQRLRLTDYMEASDKEDLEKNYKHKDMVDTDQDVVILTSTTPDEVKDKGIFRSKMVVAELGPDLSVALVGKKIGDTVDYNIGDVRHVLKILAVKEVQKIEYTPKICNCEGDCSKDCKCNE